MKKTEIYEYYAFGHDYRMLSVETKVGMKRKELSDRLDYFLTTLSDLGLQVTLKVAEKLTDILNEWKSKGDDKITEKEAEAILTELDRIDPSLDAELKLKTAYVLTKKRYPLDTLLNSPGDLLAGGVYVRLSGNAQQDYRLACIQVALSQPTAAAFHLMRMMEECVKKIYFHYKKTKRLDKPMWGPMIKELRDKKAPKPSEKLMNHLDGMRVHFRNPTQHPDAFYTMDESQDLLNQTIVGINMIFAEIVGWQG